MSRNDGTGAGRPAAGGPKPGRGRMRLWMAVNSLILMAFVGGVLQISEGGSGKSADRIHSTAADKPAPSAASATPSAPKKPAPPDYPTKAQILALSGQYFGVSAPDVPWSTEAMNAIVGSAEASPNLIEYFVNFKQGFSADSAASAYKHGALPVISLEPWDGSTETDVKLDAHKPQFALSKITAGNFDAYFTKFATDVKSFGAPVAIRFAHEMNGTWYPWAQKTNGNKAGDYINAWRHVHDLFTKAGATNVIWIWSPNNVGGTSWPITGLYPGDAYVDWVGMSAYLTVGTTAENVIGTSLKAIRKVTDKPLLITETGAEPGATKAARTAAFFTWLKAHPDVIGFVWFEKTMADGAGTDWRWDSDTNTQAAFQAGVARMTLARSPVITDLGS